VVGRDAGGELVVFFFFQAEDGIRDRTVTGVQTCALPISNLLREAARFEGSKTGYIVVDRKARQFLARTKRELLADFELKDAPTFVETKPIAKFATEKFLAREVDKVSVVYTHFINTINQRPTVQTLLPIEHGDLPKDASKLASDPLLGYIFEPNAEGVLEVMLPYYLQYQIFQMILD